MYGNLLPADPKGQVGAGLGHDHLGGHGHADPADRRHHRDRPADDDRRPDFEFLLAPDTEAPAEMHWFIEQLKARDRGRELLPHAAQHLHAARREDPRPAAWSKYLKQTIDLWGDRAEVMYGMHHWPVWGNDRVLEMLEQGPRRLPLHQRRDAAPGQPRATRRCEIAEQVEFPTELAATGRCAATTARSTTTSRRPTSTTSAGSTATRPTCTRCRPSEPAKRYVEFMGGADAALEKARGALRRGRLPLGRRGRQPRRVRRPRQPGGAGAAGRRARAARLPVRDRAVAQLLPHRRQGAARRRARAADAEHGEPRHRAGDERSSCSSTTSASASTAPRPATRRSRSTSRFPDRREAWTLLVAQRRAEPSRRQPTTTPTRTSPSTARTSTTSSSAQPRSPTRSPTGARSVEGDAAGAARVRRPARHVRVLVQHRHALNDPSASDTGARAADPRRRASSMPSDRHPKLQQMVEATGAPTPGAPGTRSLTDPTPADGDSRRACLNGTRGASRAPNAPETTGNCGNPHDRTDQAEPPGFPGLLTRKT